MQSYVGVRELRPLGITCSMSGKKAFMVPAARADANMPRPSPLENAMHLCHRDRITSQLIQYDINPHSQTFYFSI